MSAVLNTYSQCPTTLDSIFSSNSRQHSKSVIGATLSFFNDQPLSQLVNLFSRDIRNVAQHLAVLAIANSHFAGELAVITTTIVITTPAFLLPGALIGVVYYLFAIVCMSASRDQIIETSRCTLPSRHLSDILSGIVTIRAYGAEGRYAARTLNLIDKCNQTSFF
ncbi:hypothetical protein B0J13DRAFT_184734 [Dactylonectria estremocensis]|uniref:ABC transmembrane type-1 domain-containing protein n=1 Tax=Dactylonectria estremocensis TaxID=1079267 RepID=A0A9P9JF50_9HYPO|nr:hypothetical protein B0J13DRAFT_184734 [Dactylonectria estremocensis]